MYVLGKNDPRAVQLLLSLGTGKKNARKRRQNSGWRLYWAFINAAAQWAAQSEGTHNTMVDATRGAAKYFRLNVEEGLERMKLDECKGKGGGNTFQYIRAKTDAYLNKDAVAKEVSNIAQELVAIRHARSTHQDRDHWERFCHGVEYDCPLEACDTDRCRYRQRRDLERHLVEDHQIHNKNKLQSYLDDGKRFPLYNIEEK